MVERGVEISDTDALLVLTVLVDIKESALLPSRATMVNGIIEFLCVKVRKKKKKVMAHTSQRPKRAELIPVLLA